MIDEADSMQMAAEDADADADPAAPDDALVAAARQDRLEFAHIYRRYADRLYAYALERTGSPAAAEDIVADTLSTAFERLEQFDLGKGSLSAWLFTIARHRIADQHRQRARFWEVFGRLRDEGRIEPDPLDQIISHDNATSVRRALKDLPPADQELVLLRYSAGLNSREIAETVGISHGAVRMRLSRARQHLATILGENR